MPAGRSLRQRIRHVRLGPQRPGARLGQPARTLERRRGDLLAFTYTVGGAGVGAGWLADPRAVANRAGMAGLLAFVAVAAAVMFLLRHRLPVWVGDVAIVGSLALIGLGNLFLRLHTSPPLLMPYYVWVGFTCPMWFPRRRALVYAFLTALASGVVVMVARTDDALALWLSTMATLIVAFVAVSFLAGAVVRHERLAAIGEMASALSHDLRTPLTSVSNSLFLIRVGIGEEAAGRLERHFEMADRQVARAVAIAQHLVDFVKPHEPQLERVDLAQLIAEALEALPPPGGVEVSVTNSPDAVTAYVDSGQITQVVSNLVSNSYDAMPGGGSLHVAASTEGPLAVITVADTGPGLDKAVAEQAFEPFFTTKHSGTGLGLAIVRRLIEGHGGTVSIETRVGSGTKFTVRIPVAPEDREPASGL